VTGVQTCALPIYLINIQNIQAVAGQSQWFYRYTYNVGLGVAKSMPTFGVVQGGITVVGGSLIPDAIHGEAATQDETNRLNPSWRYPMRLYAYGTSQLESAIIGSSDLLTSKIDSTTRLYLDGGLRTSSPDDTTEATVQFGTYSASASNTVDTVWKIKVGDKILEVLARDITPV